MLQIKPISFNTILVIWKERLWPERQAAIESVSWIDHLGQINMNLKLGLPTFWGAFESEDHLLGVTSGFRTGPDRYRSRGLWVNPEWRGKGIAQRLTSFVMEQGRLEGCQRIWTMPRTSAWGFYQKCGFSKIGMTESYEFGPHVLAEKILEVRNA